MNKSNVLLAAGAAFAATAGLAHAQYDFNWNQQGGGTNSLVQIGAPTLWTVLNQAAGGVVDNFGGTGDSLRVCYSVDATQGGTMWANRQWRNNWFRLFGGHAASNPNPGIDVGMFSIRSTATPSTDGDACFTPFVLQPTGTLYEDIAVAGVFGLVNVANPFPTIWGLHFQWTGDPVVGATQLGEDPVLFPLFGTPLLANVVLEVQGPVDEGPHNIMYYLANTGEGLGKNLAGPGGVANGAVDYASGIFAGADPVASNAISHQRLTSFSESEGLFAAFSQPLAFGGGDAADVIFRIGDLSFTTPRLWAQKNNNQGGGAADWRVSAAPVSVNNLQLRDTLAGAETAFASSVENLCLVSLTNISWFLWSATDANVMLQRPTSWSTLVTPQKGSFILGFIGTKRHGPQRIPIEFDLAITQLFLGINAVSQGSGFTAAYDPNADPTQPWQDALFGGSFVNITAGISGFGVGAFPLVASPSPILGGFKLGVAGIGVQLDLCTGVLQPTEVATSLTLNLQ